MTEVIETMENTEGTMPETEVVTRKNEFCVISKEGNEYGWHDLQTNSVWSSNPYGEDFAVVPDDMVEAIMETCGYCDLELNEDGTEVVSFTPIEIPVIETPEPEPTEEELQWQAITDLEIAQMEYEQALTDLEIEVLSNE